MFELVRVYFFVFGILTIAGGAMGYVRAKSKASIIAGSISGLALLVAGSLMTTHLTLGLGIGLVVSLLLLGRFGSGFAKTKKVMPAGLMAALGALGAALAIVGFVRLGA